ncbi:CidA/LrgA family protein [Tumebacillus sp. ITR2]|uniref:CidA/LrgA family protein n=1 Tax=Tumebacillus amylolyticus TaxID=2801339 RepID=A0ABS1JCX1_9BACL|nr:CidA/LrgA family protein [Tumebacillus amylolyticus]MBL0388079.1 CidA/LrgA family protein [Tumebacillus amylolyticus]
MKVVRLIGQVLILTVFYEAGRLIVQALEIPIPGSLIGLGLLLIFLATGVIRLEWVEAGAALLLSEMLLFFIPASVQVVDFGSLLAKSGIQLVAVIVCSTVTVMVAVGLVTERIVRWKQGGRKWKQGTQSSV